MVCLHFVYRPKKNASRTDITNDDQKDYAFAPTYGDEYTAFHRHMISVVFFTSKKSFKVCWCIEQLGDEVPPSDDWFSYEYINAEVNNKLDNTKGLLAGDEMEKKTKNDVESINHDPNWLEIITIGNNNFLIDS